MYEIQFQKISVSKASKYLILVKNQHETKRSQISTEWTSSPIFKHIEIDHFNQLQIKICQATSSKKIKILGQANIDVNQINFSNGILLEKEIKFEQQIEGKFICIGIGYIRIIKKIKFQSFVQESQAMKKNQVGGNQHQQQQEDFQLRQNQDEELQEYDQQSNQLRVEVYCGFNFYLGGAFHLQIQWGQSIIKTRTIKDKINPVWSEGLTVQGKANKTINIKFCDKNNILQNLKFKLSNLRTMFPYHFRLLFKDQYMGAIPQVYFSLTRYSTAKFSIMDFPIRFGFKNIGQNISNMIYLIVSFDSNPKIPQFMVIDRSKIVGMAQINQYIIGKVFGDSDRIDLISLTSSKDESYFQLFKSFLHRKMHLFLININDFKAFFQNRNLAAYKLLDSKSDFQSALRKIYYHSQVLTIKKYAQIFNPTQKLEEQKPQQSIIQRWKLLSNNYVLRNQLINKTNKRIIELKQTINKKGQQLVELKKIVKQVKAVNISLTQKQKLMSLIKTKSKSSKMYAKQINQEQLIGELYYKHSILQEKKVTNSQLMLRIDSLSQIQEVQINFDDQLINNANRLLKQQQKIENMNLMQKALIKQRQIIGQLQKIYEKKQIDKKVNQALKQQSQMLRRIRQQKQSGLKNIYNIVKNNGRNGGTLANRVRNAEQNLIKLNAQYAKLKIL